jgi:NTP pyrophosphatase (non-canonical NTP hydrolase)
MKDTIHLRAIKKFGYDHQVDKLIEEMAELTSAFIQQRQGREGAEESVYEEITDVEIVLLQILSTLDSDRLNKWAEVKLNKLAELVKTKQWQYRSKHDREWKNCSNEHYEEICHLERFEFRQVEV